MRRSCLAKGGLKIGAASEKCLGKGSSSWVHVSANGLTVFRGERACDEVEFGSFGMASGVYTTLIRAVKTEIPV